jgi:C4-dicarboxylate-specific signal transduction histidine kinase
MNRKTRHVLLVEDEPAHARLVERAVLGVRSAYELVVATSMAEARSALATLTPDLLLLDLLLPDGNGIDLLHELADASSFPIIVLTSHGDERSAVEAMKAGALDYVVKSAETLADTPHIVDRGLREWAHITERKRMELQLERDRSMLARVDRISSMGEMAASIAHEVNQPLYTIMNFAKAARNFLKEESPLDVDALRECHAAIATQAAHAGDIIRRMREFVSQAPPQRTGCGIKGVIEDAVAFVNPEAIRRGVRVKFHANGVDHRVHADRIQVQQVLVNLLQNAFDAIEEARSSLPGVIVKVDEGTGVGEVDRRVRITVTDDGVGLPEDPGLSLFDPFVTTRQGGMGMGLAICKSIVEAHGGKISGVRNPDRGSTFEFTLPIRSEKDKTDGSDGIRS